MLKPSLIQRRLSSIMGISTTRTTTATNRVGFVVLALLATLIGGQGMLTGCMSVKRLNGRAVKIDGIASAKLAQPYVVQVENKLGSVRIYAKPSLKQPEVYAMVPGKNEPQIASWVAASIERQTDSNVLRVLSADPNLDKLPVALQIYVPAISGIVIRNNGGTVSVRDVTGPIEVFNGITDGNGGLVDIRTSAALTGPISINTRGGDVNLLMGRGSTGRLNISGKTGAHVIVPEVSIKGIQSSMTKYRADMGAWSQEIKVQAEDGKVTLRVDDRAE